MHKTSINWAKFTLFQAKITERSTGSSAHCSEKRDKVIYITGEERSKNSQNALSRIEEILKFYVIVDSDN